VQRVRSLCEARSASTRLIWTEQPGQHEGALNEILEEILEESLEEALSAGSPASIADTGQRMLSAVVAVGGDGTARIVGESLVAALGGVRPETVANMGAPANAPPRLALFVVPAGTGNSLYRAIWDDRPWEEELAAALGAASAARVIDALWIEETGKTVLLGASAGFLAEVLRAARRATRSVGRARYQEAALSALPRHVPFEASVAVDGVTAYEGPLSLVAVGGARHRGGTLEILPESVMDDGLLDVCAIRGSSPGRLGELALAASMGQHLGQPEVEYWQGRSVRMERSEDAPLDFEHDGDLCDAGRSVTLRVLPAALPVLCG
jgi:diacylglycerol kinase (ATP)